MILRGDAVRHVRGHDVDACTLVGGCDCPGHGHGAGVGGVIGDEIHRLHDPFAGDDVGLRSRVIWRCRTGSEDSRLKSWRACRCLIYKSSTDQAKTRGGCYDRWPACWHDVPMVPETRISYPSRADVRLYQDVHRVMHAVAEQGGAIGYELPPSPLESRQWLDDILEAVSARKAVLAAAVIGDQVEAVGSWRRGSPPFFGHHAEIEKVMVHPSARGQGLGHLVIDALVETARVAGIETLTLGVRGNNHGAISLYERHGFREWGRLPNVIEVGNERFDDVRMFIEFGRSPDVILRSSSPGGPGWSPR